VGIAVAVILFEGGLNLRLHELEHAGRTIRRLVSVGVLLSWAFGTLAAHAIAGLTWPVSLVLGAILVVTGPTVVIPMLRQARLSRRAASLLKWEAIVNDPVGALLAVLVFEFFAHGGSDASLSGVASGVLLALAASVALGVGGGYALGRAFARGYVPEFLKAPTILGTVLAVYAVANLSQAESGLLAVTALGLVLGNMGLASIVEVRRFKEYIAVLLVSAVFVVLTADLDPQTLGRLQWRDGAFIAAVLVLVRPAAVLLSTVGADIEAGERLLAAWIAPRGIVAAAVAGVFAPGLVAAGFADGEVLVPLVFGVIFATVVAHGFTIGWIARRLGVASAELDGLLIVGANPWSLALAGILKDLEVPVMVADASWHRLREARLAGLGSHFGEILSDLSERTLDLTGIGFLLAATDNDAYNALVCGRFAPELGRNRVFQLAMEQPPGAERKALSHTVRGRVAFDEDATYQELMKRHYRGWTFQKTRLSESYTYEQYLAQCAEEAQQLLLVREGGMVVFNSAEQPFEPRSGDVVVCYTPQRPSQGERRKARADAPA
jgi:NhaP-type Na+/H+ or K+/H+ antiporter